MNRPVFLPPTGTLALCALTLTGSIAQSLARSVPWTTLFGAIPAAAFPPTGWFETAHGQAVPVGLTLVTHLFFHGGWWHVVPNLTALWVFGAIAEPAMGARGFLATYVVSGAVGVLGVGWLLPHERMPAAGASLAISGVVGAHGALRASGKTIALELAMAAGTTLYLALRTPPVRADLASSILYHILPFEAAWLAVRGYLWTKKLRN